MNFHCPQCGEDTPTLCEGRCEECRTENQRRLDEHNSQHDRWYNSTEPERDAAIRRAANLPNYY